jgi:predicted regulator of Ras-like GTPase activity (Roadblock/LC7/MglB family)
MDAEQALAELKELSSQVERAVVLDPAGEILAGTDASQAEREALAQATTALLGAAGELHAGAAGVARAEVELAEGGFFVLREGERAIGATTGPDATSGLVVYDLRTCLHAIEVKPKRRRAAKRAAEESPSEETQE